MVRVAQFFLTHGVYVHRESRKTIHSNIVHNFAKC